VGSQGRLFFWALQVNLFVASEGRHKTNEVVVARPDVSTVVAYAPSDSPESTFIALVREFRSPAATRDGFVLELPGGSTWNEDEDAQSTAVHEFGDETGLRLDPQRLRRLTTRQLVGTLSAHKATVFAYELTDHELEELRAEAGRAHGVTEDTERTYVEVHSLAEILDGNVEVDWSNLGMILSAIG
jgi:ADP-ribose pyrophosphatase YjhB (NUDIX family)